MIIGEKIHSLEYEGEEHEQLTDVDVKELASALKHPENKFHGPLDLSNNVHLTDLSGLYISEIFSTESGITELNLSGNTLLESKTGQFIGEALLANPSYPISKLTFKDVRLEETGLYRLLEAVNLNKHVQKLHVGVISDYGLKALAELLRANRSLKKLTFQEDETKPWGEEAKHAFCQMLKKHTELEAVKFKSAKRPGSEEKANAEFKNEIEFYTNKKLTEHKLSKKFEQRHLDCDPQHMFESILQLLEKKKNQKKMPVRKFFNNTVGTILNDALFALKKKQSKEPENLEIFAKKGSIKFVAMYLLENLPE